MQKIAAEQGVGGAIDYYGVVDPLAEDMKAIDQAAGWSFTRSTSGTQAKPDFRCRQMGTKCFTENH